MTRPPHPQRCETCTKCPFLFGTYFDERMKNPIAQTTALIGCASHSSSPAAAPVPDRRDTTRFLESLENVECGSCGISVAECDIDACCHKMHNLVAEHDEQIRQEAAVKERERIMGAIIGFCTAPHAAPLHDLTASRISKFAESLREEKS